MNKKNYKNYIIISALLSVIMFFSTVVFAGMGEGLGKAINKNLDQLSFKWTKGSGNTLSGISFGLKKSLLAAEIKKFPSQKPNSKLTIKNFRLNKVIAQGAELKIDIKADGNYVASKFLKAGADLEARLFIKFNQTTKYIRIWKLDITKAKLNKGIPGVNIKSIVKAAVEKKFKTQLVNASKVVDKMNEYGLVFQNFAVEGNAIYIAARTSKSIPVDANLEAALNKLQSGDFNALKPFVSKFK